MKGSNSRWTTVAPNELSERHSITGISRIPEAEVGFDGRKARVILVPLPIGTSFFGPSIAFTAKFPTCLITSQISLRRYHFLDIFSRSFLLSPVLRSLAFLFFYPRLLCHRGGFRMSAMFDESGRSVRVLLDTF